MKKSSCKYFFILLSFLCFFCTRVVQAHEVGSSYSVFMSSSRYTGSYCTGTLSYFDITKNASGDYLAKLKEGYFSTEPVTESVTCSYTLDNNTGIRNGTVTYSFTYNGSTTSMNKNIVTHMYQGYDTTYDVINGSSLRGVVKRIYGVSISSGSSYISADCAEDSTVCTISLESLEYSSSIRTAVLEFNYENAYGVVGHVKVTVQIHSSGTLYANTGSYGTCSAFGSGWSLDSGDTYLYHYEGGTITLPTCSVDSSRNPFIKFVGWSNNYDLTNTLDNCNSPIIAGGSAFTPDLSSNTYSTCYASTGGIILNVGRGALTSTAGYTYKGGAYYRTVEGSVSLPTPKPPSGFEFKGWLRNGSGDRIDGGSSVDADGSTYVAVYERPDVSYETDDVIKTLIVGSTSVYALSGVTFKASSCASSDSSKVSVSTTSSGACYLTPLEPTSGSSYVTITAQDASGNTYQMKAQVVSRVAESEAELGEDSSFVIELPNLGELVGVSTTTTVGAITNSSCKTYTVTKGPDSKQFGSYTSGGVGVGYMRTYIATSQCSDGKKYAALCLDPGRIGPSSKTYVIERTLRPKHNNFDKGIIYILQELTNKGLTQADMLEANNKYKIAANIAARIIAIMEGEDAASTQGAVRSHYNIYVSLKNHYKSTGNLNLSSWGWYSDAWSTEIKNLTLYYVQNYKSFDLSVVSDETVNEAKSGTWETETSTLLIEGTATLPSGATIRNSDIKVVCPSGASCALAQAIISGTKIDYKVRARIGDSKLTEDNIYLSIDYKLSSNAVSAENAMLLRPSDSSNLQRMIVFNPSAYHVNVPIFTKKIHEDVCRVHICTDASCTIDETLFEQMDCCSYITDHTSEIYKTYCGGGCLFSNYSLSCNIDSSGTGEIRDYYKVYEATEATKETPKFATCVIDVQRKINEDNKTDTYTDDAGNKYSLTKYTSNRYCRVSCSEAWDFSMAGFKDFTGTNAVLAGSYFQINEDVYLSGKRTCVTTYIDYEQYLKDVDEKAEEMRKSWNEFSDRGVVYDNIKNQTLETTHFKNSKDASGPMTVYNYDGKVSHHDKTEIEVCGFDSHSDTQESTSGTPADFCDGDYFDCSCSSGTSTYSCDCSTTCSGSGTSRTCSESCSTCTKYTKSCSWKTYKGECWRVDADASLKCNRFEVFSSAGHPFDKYEHSGDPYARLASYTPGVGTTAQAMTLSNDSTGTTSSVGSIFYSYPSNGACESDPALSGSQTVSDDSMYETLLARTSYRGSNLKSAMNSYASKTNTIRTQIQTYTKHFSACQNFTIVNTNDIRGGSYQTNDLQYDYTGGNSYKIEHSSPIITNFASNATKITTAYSPKTAYEYEEEEYMSILGSDAVLEFNKDYNSGTTGDDNEPDVDSGVCVSYTNGDGKTSQICNNKYEKYAYKEATPWKNNSDNGKKYEGGAGAFSTETDTTFIVCAATNYGDGRKKGDTSIGDCTDATFNYYKVNYIKQSILNSGYFSNKDYWFVNQKTDIKSHAATRTKAAQKYSDSKTNWSKLGTNHNVFPTKLTTRRNIYQYVYAFNDIGVYADGKLGRVMSSNANSLLGYYTHACFYEVKEELCLCCGDPIESTTIQEDSQVVTESTVTKVDGSAYTYSNPTLISEEGVLGFYNSTISLNDMDSGTGRTLAKNWSNASNYFYGGVLYETSKGGELVNAIETKGETIYDEKPEYSYTLNPSALAHLRNTDDEYGVVSSNLQVFGAFPLDMSKSDMEKYPVLTHYANKVLVTDFKSYITPEYRSTVLTNVSSMGAGAGCYVTSSNVAQASSKVRSCRFVDYVDTNSDGKQIRLAFK